MTLLTRLPSQHAVRLLQLLFIAAFITIAVDTWQRQQHQVIALLDSQQNSSIERLLQQSAHSAAAALRSDDTEALQWVVDHLSTQPEVISATVFNYHGAKMADAQSLFGPSQLPQAAQLEQALNHFTPYTIMVQQQGESLGYLRLRINAQVVQRENWLNFQRLLQYQLPLLASAVMIGFMCARIFSSK
ncbi:MAG: AhpA/YtjB family protein [Ferrimonas sp.]